MDMSKSMTVDLKGDSEVVVTRRFDAPLELVFRAMNEPDLMKRWMLGPPGWSMPVCDVDFRVGGSYTFRWRSDEDGTEFGFVGEFREIDAPHRVVQTQRSADAGDVEGEAIITLLLAAQGAFTLMTTIMDFGFADLRDMAMATGMTDGMGTSYQGLDAVLADLAA